MLTLALLFISYLIFVKWNFIFALRKSEPTKTGLAGPVATALIATEHEQVSWSNNHFDFIELILWDKALKDFQLLCLSSK